ncbi:M23 family metallopeptidase [Portibacter marinus]|uniref:M23 family metallopeptidase n=1 Tax=Portibacter marinus TaxID=2898660 RepID=UPI001F3C6AE0|nr:M23 family metallopeptidase [Portibacter marinus]
MAKTRYHPILETFSDALISEILLNLPHLKTMRTQYYLTIIIISACISQYKSQEKIQGLADTIIFEKILLDGDTAFIDQSTQEILTKREYRMLAETVEPSYIEPLLEDFWDTMQVNPYKSVALQYPFLLTFQDTIYHPPIDGRMVVTSRFGRRRRGPHRGIDIDLEIGDSVRTVLGGQVRFVGYSRGHGKTVVVRHDNDLETVYAHLSEYKVKTNEFVERGQVLGLGGITGNARGSHLHLEIRHKGVCINPEYLFNFYNPHIFADSLWVTEGLTNPLRHSSYRKGSYEVLTSRELADGYDARAEKIYVVRQGDTLWGIARKNGMRVSDLVQMNKNKVSATSTLRIGQHLVISP